MRNTENKIEEMYIEQCIENKKPGSVTFALDPPYRSTPMHEKKLGRHAVDGEPFTDGSGKMYIRLNGTIRRL